MALSLKHFHPTPYEDRHDDPLARVLQPPPDETPDARARREQQQREATRISLEIDEGIQEARKLFEKRKKAVKVLLLGQAESGKSTTLKNFQLTFTPAHFRNERLAWRTIIQLNLVRSLKTLLDIIQDELAAPTIVPPPIPSPSSSPPTTTPGMSEKARGKLPAHAPIPLPTSSSHTHTPHGSISLSRSPSPSGKANGTGKQNGNGNGKQTTRSVRFSTHPAPPGTPPLFEVHKKARMRLGGLMEREGEMTRRLFPELQKGLEALRDVALGVGVGGGGDIEGEGGVTTGVGVGGVGGGGAGTGTGMREVCVRAGNGWKHVLASLQAQAQAQGDTKRNKNTNAAANANQTGVDELTAELAARRDDVVGLWEDAGVQSVLRRRGVRLQDMPGFFLNDAARIAVTSYEPTDDDIVRARLRTLGVEEHRFAMENGAAGSEWYIYDVGGSRSSRPSWIPFFDDVQAIIFLAPLAFNLMLEEDSRVNRLEDSIGLWRTICENKLLDGATLILFFNKMDILQATLAAGIRVQKFVPSYGDQPNDVPSVVKYFREKFRGYHKRLSPKPRPFYCHETSVVDTRATRVILVGVREGILRAHLQSVNVI